MWKAHAKNTCQTHTREKHMRKTPLLPLGCASAGRYVGCQGSAATARFSPRFTVPLLWGHFDESFLQPSRPQAAHFPIAHRLRKSPDTAAKKATCPSHEQGTRWLCATHCLLHSLRPQYVLQRKYDDSRAGNPKKNETHHQSSSAIKIIVIFVREFLVHNCMLLSAPYVFLYNSSYRLPGGCQTSYDKNKILFWYYETCYARNDCKPQLKLPTSPWYYTFSYTFTHAAYMLLMPHIPHLLHAFMFLVAECAGCHHSLFVLFLLRNTIRNHTP